MATAKKKTKALSKTALAIKKGRRSKGLTQAEFAGKVGLKTHNINAYEQGRSRPKMEDFKKIARYFRCSIESLI